MQPKEERRAMGGQKDPLEHQGVGKGRKAEMREAKATEAHTQGAPEQSFWVAQLAGTEKGLL